MSSGGARKGAGRPKKADAVVCRSVALTPNEWLDIDRERGDLSLGDYLRLLRKKRALWRMN